MKQPKNLLHLPKTTKNTCKIANKLLMNVPSGEINMQSKHDLICHVAKVKATTAAHPIADEIPFLAYLLFPLNPMFQKNQKKIYFTQNKEINIHKIVHVLMFQQLLVNKHHTMRDSKFGREVVWLRSLTKQKKTRRSVRSYNHTSII